MAIKVVIVGAGSLFGSRLSIDILSSRSLQDVTIGLCDMNATRLEQVRRYIQRGMDHYKLPGRLIASTDRKDLLPGADFVVTSISANGGAYWGFPYSAEIEIPRRYGIDQCVGDTTSVGAVFRFLRTGPVQQQIFRDVESLCPGALVLNHTNPMAMLTWLHALASPVRSVGLCHGVQYTTQKLAKWVGVPYGEVSYKAAGINHLAWILEFRRGQEDLYPRIRQAAEDPENRKGEEVRCEILKQFGCFCTESSGHDSEYLPYFRRTAELRAEYDLKPTEVPAAAQERVWMKDPGAGGDAPPVPKLWRSDEYTASIIEAIVGNAPCRFNGNVMNTGLITNLPLGCCVEVPCLVDASGIHPCHVGDLPPHLAALNRSNIAVHELAVQAVLNRDRDAAFLACALDPNAAAILSLPKLRAMFDELWEAEKDLLAWFDPKRSGPVHEGFAP